MKREIAAYARELGAGDKAALAMLGRLGASSAGQTEAVLRAIYAALDHPGVFSGTELRQAAHVGKKGTGDIIANCIDQGLLECSGPKRGGFTYRPTKAMSDLARAHSILDTQVLSTDLALPKAVVRGRALGLAAITDTTIVTPSNMTKMSSDLGMHPELLLHRGVAALSGLYRRSLSDLRNRFFTQSNESSPADTAAARVGQLAEARYYSPTTVVNTLFAAVAFGPRAYGIAQLADMSGLSPPWTNHIVSKCTDRGLLATGQKTELDSAIVPGTIARKNTPALFELAAGINRWDLQLLHGATGVGVAELRGQAISTAGVGYGFEAVRPLPSLDAVPPQAARLGLCALADVQQVPLDSIVYDLIVGFGRQG